MQTISGVFDGGVTCVKLSNCHEYVVCSSADGYSIKLVDLRKQKVLKTFEHANYFNNHEFNKCCFGPNEQYVMAGGSCGSIFVWDKLKGSLKTALKTASHQGVIVAVDFHNVTG